MHNVYFVRVSINFNKTDWFHSYSKWTNPIKNVVPLNFNNKNLLTY